MKKQTRTGGCLCEGVRYTLSGDCRGVVNCFCTQCQKTSGHHFAATQVDNDQFVLDKDETLNWYQSSKIAERGFCNRCGSSLFWRTIGGETISITAGTIDKPTHLNTTANIFTKDMSDYHDLPKVKP